jgi:hypothetical protein
MLNFSKTVKIKFVGRPKKMDETSEVDLDINDLVKNEYQLASNASKNRSFNSKERSLKSNGLMARSKIF